MTSNGCTELWFPVADLLPLLDHCMIAYGHAPDPEHGAAPLLHLSAQGDELFSLTTNAVPALLVDAFDPASAQRVYAIGHGHTISGATYPADVDRYGPPVQLASIPLTTGRPGPFGHLVDQLRGAARVGCDWLVLTLDPDGRLDVSVRPTPHPAPPARWRYARLELVCLPGRWPAQFVDNATHQGWLLPRFSREVAQQIADLAATDAVPHPLTLIELTDTPAAQLPATAPRRLVGPDPDGYYRLGLPEPGLDTAGLAGHSTPIQKTDLRAGDLLINPGSGITGHIVIFDRWTDATMTSYLGYEQSGDGGAHHRVIPYPYFAGYMQIDPYRFAS